MSTAARSFGISSEQIGLRTQYNPKQTTGAIAVHARIPYTISIPDCWTVANGSTCIWSSSTETSVELPAKVLSPNEMNSGMHPSCTGASAKLTTCVMTGLILKTQMKPMQMPVVVAGIGHNPPQMPQVSAKAT